ncbi:hypothetical protein [Peribacillus simplex]|uniref:hypothetical protein n=1 Tax=Peribacillus simplex TaxID=1478 RepID=UPI0024C1D76F|nr:hypothetical protein [Peribacillus simplex]WHY56004.1 hypothetical protein QNH43_23170 [Peribacillus simplex]
MLGFAYHTKYRSLGDSPSMIKALFVKIVFKTERFNVDWSASARLLWGLTARPAESEHLEGKSTTPLYLVNSNKVCENSHDKKAAKQTKGKACFKSLIKTCFYIPLNCPSRA